MSNDLFDFGDLSPAMGAFKEGFDTLKRRTERLQEQLRGDGQTLPYDIVTYTADPQGAEAHRLALESIARFYFGESGEADAPFQTGVLCIREETLELVNAVNQARLDLKDAAAKVRLDINDRKMDINQVIKHACTEAFNLKRPGRSDAFNTYLKQLGLARIDLTHCYSQIRVLPEGTVSVSYTWNRKHSAMKKFTAKDVLKLIVNDADDTKATITDLIAQVPVNHILVQKKILKPSLRANLVWSHGSLDNEFDRKAVTVSGIMLLTGEELPDLMWRDKPIEGEASKQKKTRFSRRANPEMQLSREVYIKKYDLYLRKSHDDDPAFR